MVESLEERFKAAIIESYRVNGRARTVTQGAELAWQATRHLFVGAALDEVVRVSAVAGMYDDDDF